MFLCYRHLYGNTVGRTEESCAAEERKRRGGWGGAGEAVCCLWRSTILTPHRRTWTGLWSDERPTLQHRFTVTMDTQDTALYMCVYCVHTSADTARTLIPRRFVCALCMLTFPTDSVNTELVLLKSSCSKENQNLVLMEQNCIGLALIRANLVQEEEYFLS